MSKDVVVDSSEIRQTLSDWLQARMPVADWASLATELASISDGTHDRQVFKLFSLMPRRVGKADLNLDPDALSTANRLCPGWDPRAWSLEQAARSLLLLHLPQTDAAKVSYWFEQLFTTSGLQELIALHQTLPLLPHPERYRFWADEGIRSHMTGVFNAIALNNPYPAWHFDQAAWNQLILKTIFIDSPLHPIYGLDDRANPTLARMLVDYVHERWAAKRRVTPEIWRLIGPFVNETMLPDLAQALAMDDCIQQKAVTLACQTSAYQPAQALLVGKTTTTTWAEIYQQRQAVITTAGIA
jgi:hypothetical protein